MKCPKCKSERVTTVKHGDNTTHGCRRCRHHWSSKPKDK